MNLITDDTFVFTWSGKKASVSNPPDPEDFAISIARLPRFTGNTRTWWTGLSHQVVATYIVRMFNKLAMHGTSIHDSVESLTGDKPTPFKTEEEIEFENRALVSIYKDNNVELTEEILKDIKRADRISLVAEALVLLPGNTHDFFRTFIPEEDKGYLAPAMDFVERLSRFQNTHFGAYQPRGGAVLSYLNFVLQAREGLDIEEVYKDMMKSFYAMGLRYRKEDIEGWPIITPSSRK